MNAPRLLRVGAIGIATGVVTAVVVAAFLTIGTPGRARAEAFDRQRVRGLADDASDLFENYGRGVALPGMLLVPGSDPVNFKPYEYTRLSKTNYTLCAVFELPTPLTHTDMDVAVFWRHPAGHHCYLFDVRRRVESTL